MQGGTPVFVLHVNGQRDLKQAYECSKEMWILVSSLYREQTMCSTDIEKDNKNILMAMQRGVGGSFLK